MNSNISLQEFFYEVYLPSIAHLDKKTRDSRVRLMKKYIGTYGAIPLADIENTTFYQLYQDLIENGLSPSSAYIVFIIIRGILKLAISTGLIPQNRYPFLSNKMHHTRNALSVPSPKFDPHWYTLAETRYLDSCLGNTMIDHMLRFTMYTGLKSGELNALKTTDYDSSRNMLSITHVLKILNPNDSRTELVPLPDNSRKRRTILLSTPARQALEAAICDSTHRPAGSDAEASGGIHVFRIFNNQLISPAMIHKHCQSRLDQNHLDPARVNLSLLRDNFIVLCLRTGWSTAAVQEYAGIRMPVSLVPHKKIAESTMSAFLNNKRRN